MAGVDYAKYLVTEPLWEAGPGVTNRQSPTMTFMSSTQVPEANCYIEFGWIWGMPDPNPHVYEHVHDFDEIILHIGGDPCRSRKTSAPRWSTTSVDSRSPSRRPAGYSCRKASPTDRTRGRTSGNPT